jgi:hypothetical protein
MRVLRSFNDSICTGKHLSDTHKYLILQDLEQGTVTFPLIFNFASEHVILLGHENKQRLAVNGPRQFLVNAYDVNLLGENIHSIKAIKSFISVQM